MRHVYRCIPRPCIFLHYLVVPTYVLKTEDECPGDAEIDQFTARFVDPFLMRPYALPLGSVRCHCAPVVSDRPPGRLGTWISVSGVRGLPCRQKRAMTYLSCKRLASGVSRSMLVMIRIAQARYLASQADPMLGVSFCEYCLLARASLDSPVKADRVQNANTHESLKGRHAGR